MVTVSNVRVERSEDGCLLSGDVGGRELWIRFPSDISVTPRGEPFLIFALLMGMSRGEDVSFDESAPLSPKVLQSLVEIQSILKTWTPGFSEVSIKATAVPVPNANPGVACSFSGGVDSFFTFLRHREEITTLFSLNGFDLGADGMDGGYAQLAEKNKSIARVFGKKYVAFESNFRKLGAELDISWSYLHGPFLCNLMAALGFNGYYIPASFTYRELQAWGSHPLLDPMWSSETTKVIHDGAGYGRFEKTAAIAVVPTALQELQVCWRSKTHNCGNCGKCARTMVTLEVLGVTGGPFPDRDLSQMVRAMKVKDVHTVSYVEDIIVNAEKRGRLDIVLPLVAHMRRGKAKLRLKKMRDRLLSLSSIFNRPRATGQQPAHPARMHIPEARISL